jgi:hypothetical protein
LLRITLFRRLFCPHLFQFTHVFGFHSHKNATIRPFKASHFGDTPSVPRVLRDKKAPCGAPFGLAVAKLRNVFVALNGPIFFVLGFGLFQLVDRVTHAIFHLANRVASFAFGLFRQTLGLGFIVTCPLAYLTLNAPGDVFSFPFYAFLIHKK